MPRPEITIHKKHRYERTNRRCEA